MLIIKKKNNNIFNSKIDIIKLREETNNGNAKRNHQNF